MQILDRFHDPAAPIDLCQCGAVLTSNDADECWDCRLLSAEINEVPTWPLWIAVVVIAIFCGLLTPLAWATFKIVRE